MTFNKYPSIKNHDGTEMDSMRAAVEDHSDIESQRDLKWYVTEKLHGSNLQVIFDKQTGKVTFGSRNNHLGDSVDFQGLKTIADKLDLYIRQLAEMIMNDFTVLTVYGELLGGNYPGVTTPKGCKRIQKGVAYCGENRFFVFDVAMDGKFVDKEIANRLLVFTEFDRVPEIGIYDSLEAALGCNHEFRSRVPSMLGLPEHPEKNICEGIVISPSTAIYTQGGSRVIIKKKGGKFAEISGAKRNAYAVKKIHNYINDNRYNAAFSKIGRHDIVEITTEMTNDIVREYVEKNVELFGGEDSEKAIKALRKKVSNQVHRFVKKKMP